MKKVGLTKYEEEDLIALLEDTTSKLKERNDKLRVAREKLRATKMRVTKMRAIIHYQRERIIELYRASNNSALLSPPFKGGVI